MNFMSSGDARRTFLANSQCSNGLCDSGVAGVRWYRDACYLAGEFLLELL